MRSPLSARRVLLAALLSPTAAQPQSGGAMAPAHTASEALNRAADAPMRFILRLAPPPRPAAAASRAAGPGSAPSRPAAGAARASPAVVPGAATTASAATAPGARRPGTGASAALVPAAAGAASNASTPGEAQAAPAAPASHASQVSMAAHGALAAQAAPGPAAPPAAAPASPAPAEPVPLRTDLPQLRPEQLRQQLRGTVRVRFEVLPDGSTAHPRVVASTQRELDRPSLQAVQGWRFKPSGETRTVETELVYDLR